MSAGDSAGTVSITLPVGSTRRTGEAGPCDCSTAPMLAYAVLLAADKYPARVEQREAGPGHRFTDNP